MSVNILSYLNQIAKYLKVVPGKLTIESNTVAVHSQDNKIVKGFSNILLHYLNASNLKGKSKEEKAEVCQWIEYGIVYGTQCNNSANVHQIFLELNNVLATRSYFVAHSLTIADIVLYYILYNVMESISYLDKEKYVHVSRWFDNMQQDTNLRQKNKLIDFNTSFLSTVAPARH